MPRPPGIGNRETSEVVVFSPDSTQLAVGTNYGVFLYDVQTLLDRGVDQERPDATLVIEPRDDDGVRGPTYSVSWSPYFWGEPHIAVADLGGTRTF